MSKPVINIIGHSCIDHNTIDGTKYEKWGSSAMYITEHYLKHLGIKSHMVSSYGKYFSKYTDDFVFTQNPKENKALLYENIVTNGHRGDMFSAQFTISLHKKLHLHDAGHEAHKTTAQALLAEPLA